MRPSHRLALAALALVVVGSAAIADVSGPQAVKARQAHMKALGASAKAVGEQIRAPAADLGVVRAEAAKIDAAAKALPTWFPAGSGPSSGAKTEALPLIWTDTVGFAAKQRALAAAAAKFDQIAQAGDAAAINPAFREVAAACKSCHQTYKEKDKD